MVGIDLTSTLVDSAGDVDGHPKFGRNSLFQFGVGVGYDITKAWRVYLDYAAEVSSDIYHNLNAGVQFKF